jgi:hypothetical protein
MNWCSRPRPKLDIPCCGNGRRGGTIQIDIADVPVRELIMYSPSRRLQALLMTHPANRRGGRSSRLNFERVMCAGSRQRATRSGRCASTTRDCTGRASRRRTARRDTTPPRHPTPGTPSGPPCRSHQSDGAAWGRRSRLRTGLRAWRWRCDGLGLTRPPHTLLSANMPWHRPDVSTDTSSSCPTAWGGAGG